MATLTPALTSTMCNNLALCSYDHALCARKNLAGPCHVPQPPIPSKKYEQQRHSLSQDLSASHSLLALTLCVIHLYFCTKLGELMVAAYFSLVAGWGWLGVVSWLCVTYHVIRLYAGKYNNSSVHSVNSPWPRVWPVSIHPFSGLGPMCFQSLCNLGED